MEITIYIQVSIMDGSGVSRQSTVWVIVHIQDENDNTPEFPQRVYCISLPERDWNKYGDPVYRVFAYDRDEGPNAELTYSIVDGNEDRKFFIDSKTAMVYSRKMVTAGANDILTVHDSFIKHTHFFVVSITLVFHLLYVLLPKSVAFAYSADKSRGQWDPAEVVNCTATCRVDQKTFAFPKGLAIHGV